MTTQTNTVPIVGFFVKAGPLGNKRHIIAPATTFIEGEDDFVCGPVYADGTVDAVFVRWLTCIPASEVARLQAGDTIRVDVDWLNAHGLG